MAKKKWLPIVLIAVAVVAVAVALIFGLRNVGAGQSADKPAILSTGADFKHWFGEGKKLSKKENTTYYFKLSGDVKISAEGLIAGGNTVYIDLDGHSITGGENRAFALSHGGVLNLSGGTVETAGANDNGGVIFMDGAACQLTLDNVTLSNTGDTEITDRLTGGVIYANSPAEAAGTVTLHGGTVINGSASGKRRTGGAITVAGGTSLYIHDATVQNGKARTSGNIHLEGQATMYLLGGTVTGGTAVHTDPVDGFGGNIYVQSLSALHLYSGTVSGGVAEASGGNIYVSCTGGDNSGLHLYGGTVEGGVAKTEGGNIYAIEKTSNVRVYGGSITGGNAVQGGNIALQDAVMELRGGTLTGLATSEKLVNGGNIYAATANISIYDGTIDQGLAQNYGGNVYVTDSVLNIYGGTMTRGAVSAAEVTKGGGNLYAGRASVVNMYGGEISDGISNCFDTNKEASAAGGNVMIAGTTKMQLFGGTIKNGTVHGAITRGGGVYVYGQGNGYDTVFHMYGGTVSNGLTDNKMRGMCIGSYSATSNDKGFGTARLFAGDIIYTGPADDANKVYTIHGNKTSKRDVLLYDPTGLEGLYNRTTTGACPDESHNTVTAEVAATCLTHGATEHTCKTCGVWYEIAAEPTGHSEQTEASDHGTVEHTCTACDALWYTEETP